MDKATVVSCGSMLGGQARCVVLCAAFRALVFARRV